MNDLVLNLPTLGFVVSTRVALGIGIGLLLSERLPRDRRQAVGIALVSVGAATTIPAIMAVLRSRRPSPDLIPFASRAM